MVDVRGLAGCGKSRLLDELTQVFQARGHLVLRGDAHKSVDTSSFEVFETLLNAAIKEPHKRDRIQQGLRLVDSHSTAVLVNLFPHLNELTESNSAENLGPDFFGENRSIEGSY